MKTRMNTEQLENHRNELDREFFSKIINATDHKQQKAYECSYRKWVKAGRPIELKGV